LKKKLTIFGYPTVIFFSPEGKELDRFSKYEDPEDFLKRLMSLK
jgi:thioredoxin-related protein